MKNKQLADERNKLLTSIIKVSELPLFVLAIVWLALVIADLTDRSNSSCFPRFFEAPAVSLENATKFF